MAVHVSNSLYPNLPYLENLEESLFFLIELCYTMSIEYYL